MHSNAVVSITKIDRNKIVTGPNKIHYVRQTVHLKPNFTDKLVKFREIEDDTVLAFRLFRNRKNVGNILARTGGDYFNNITGQKFFNLNRANFYKFMRMRSRNKIGLIWCFLKLNKITIAYNI